MKKAVGLAVLILGAFIGAGFSSGREVYVFFARFGWVSIPMAICVGMILYFIFMYFLSYDINQNTRLYAIFRYVVTISTFVLTATMFAGCNALSHMLGTWVSILTVGICVVLCIYRTSGLKLTNYILLPLILVFIFALIFLSPLDVSICGANGLLMSSAKYVGLNSILLSIFLMQVSGEYSLKEKKQASIIASVVLTVFLIIISLLLMGSPDSVAKSNMPLITLAFSKSKFWGYALCLVVWAGLVTTLVSGLYVVFGEIQNIRPRHSKYLNLFVVIFSFALSMLGWNFLTTKVYSVLGTISIVIILLLIIETNICKKSIKNRRE